MSFPFITVPQFFDSSGAPLANGTIEFRNPNDDTYINSYPTAAAADAQGTANANPLTLNSRGEAAGGLYLEDGVEYKVTLRSEWPDALTPGDIIWTQTVRCPVDLYYARATSDETTGSMTIADPSYPPGDPARYGTVGAADDSAILNTTATFCSTYGVPMQLAGRTYTVGDNVTFPYGTKLVSDGAVIDGSSITASANLGDYGEVVRFGTSSTTAPTPATTGARIDRGEYTITMSSSVTGIAAEDIILIYDTTDSSYSGFRTHYRKGEMMRVQSVSGTSVKGYSPLFDDYDSGINVTKLNGGSFSISGALKVIGGAATDTELTGAVMIDGAIDSDFSNIEAYDGEHAAARTRLCFNCVIPRIARSKRDHATATKYGIQIGVSQHMYGDAGYYFGARHGLTCGATGGEAIAIVTRDIRVDAVFGSVGSPSTGDVSAVYPHGNCEYYRFSGIALGGVDMGGNHGEWHGDSYAVNANGDSGSGRCIQFDEPLGWNFKISGRCFSDIDPMDNSRGVVDLGGNDNDATSNTIYGGTLDISGLVIDAPLATALVRIRNRGSSPYATTTLDGNASTTTIPLTSTTGFLANQYAKVTLDDGSFHTSKIVTVNAGVSIVLADAVPSAATSGVACESGSPIIVLANNITSPRNNVSSVWFRYDTVSGQNAARVDISNSQINGQAVNQQGQSVVVSGADVCVGAATLYTSTLTGLSVDDTGSTVAYRDDQTVTIDLPTLSGTSDANTATITGMPAQYRPRVTKSTQVRVRDNNTWALGWCQIGTDGVITLYPDMDAVSTGWTASGVKSFTAQSITYTVT